MQLLELNDIFQTIIQTEKENPKFIGIIDVKTLIKIVGYLEKTEKLKSVQYRVTFNKKTVNHTFVGKSSVDFGEYLSILNNL